MDGGVALEERVGLGGGERLVEEGECQGPDNQVKRQEPEMPGGGRPQRHRVDGLRREISWGFQEVADGRYQVV